MISPIVDKFKQHPGEVGENYWQHFRHAFGFASQLFVASSACLVHAILPFVCTSTGSTKVKNLYSRMVQDRSKVCGTDMEDLVDHQMASNVTVNVSSKA